MHRKVPEHKADRELAEKAGLPVAALSSSDNPMVRKTDSSVMMNNL